jgi:tRNA A-37 threonylcarbamoyl transferase component Bud32
MKKELHHLKDYVRVSDDGWTGYIHTDFQGIPVALLVDPAAPDERRGAVEKVRSSDTAEVFRYSMNLRGTSEILYLKKFPHRSISDAVKCLFRPSRAKRAFNASLMLVKSGFKTPATVAYLHKSEGPFSRGDILVTEGISHAVPVPEALKESPGNAFSMELNARRKMLREFGRTIGRMHSAGISHGDLRAGNVFVREENDRFQFIFIDNERTRKYPLPGLRLRLKNLVQLNLARNISNTDRMRFWTGYLETSLISHLHRKRIARAVIKGTKARQAKRAQTHLGHAGANLQSHWAVQGAQSGPFAGYFLTAFCKGDTAAEFLKQLERLTETGALLKNDTATRLVRCGYHGWDIVIKRFNHQGLWHSLRHTLKGSRARKCWHFGHRLRAAGISCADPIGVVEKRKYGLIWESYILNAFVEGPDLQRFLRNEAVSKQAKDAVMKKVHALVSRLADHRISHNDLKPSNLIIKDDSPVLIDLDSMKQHCCRWVTAFYQWKMENKVRNRIRYEKDRL